MSPHDNQRTVLPKRIIVMRHGESRGNLDSAAYSTIPDHQIPLTEAGLAQARQAGAQLRDLIAGCSSPQWRAYFYVSPYARARSTLREIGRAFSKRRVIGVREECRIREQDFGNFQVKERMKVIKQTRERFGRFFYRFPEGESAADVFDRVCGIFFFSFSFLCFLWFLVALFMGFGSSSLFSFLFFFKLYSEEFLDVFSLIFVLCCLVS